MLCAFYLLVSYICFLHYPALGILVGLGLNTAALHRGLALSKKLFFIATLKKAMFYIMLSLSEQKSVLKCRYPSCNLQVNPYKYTRLDSRNLLIPGMPISFGTTSFVRLHAVFFGACCP